MQTNNIIATAKHFLGHGCVTGDSHCNTVFIEGNMKEINKFKSLIDSSVVPLIVSHISINLNDKYDTKELPALISRNIVTDFIRNELRFNGLIITDAMNMGGVIKFDKHAFNAVKAGCDLILMPTNEYKLWLAIKNEMSQNINFKNQIYTSIKRIIRLKIYFQLF